MDVFNQNGNFRNGYLQTASTALIQIWRNADYLDQNVSATIDKGFEIYYTLRVFIVHASSADVDVPNPGLRHGLGMTIMLPTYAIFGNISAVFLYKPY